VIHIIPSGVFTNTYQGSYKDTISRVRFFESSDGNYQQVRLDNDDATAVLPRADEESDPTFLIEYTSFPATVKAIRKRYPSAFIAVRSHNLEPLQHFDNHGWWPSGKGPLWMAYGMFRLFRGDLAVKRFANVIYSISEWENRVYWNRLPGRARVEWLPYYCPDHLVPERYSSAESLTTPIAAAPERKIIACLPTSQKNRKSWDLATRFLALAKSVKTAGDVDYEFVMTGRLADWGLPASPFVSWAGMVDDLPALLKRTKAVCLLSPLGYGFKTTIADAIAHGCYVLAHPALARRCPEILLPAIIPLDTARTETMQLAMERLELPCSGSGINDMLREVNHSMLERAFRDHLVNVNANVSRSRRSDIALSAKESSQETGIT